MSKELEALESLKAALHNEWLRFYPQFKELDEKTKFVDGVRMVGSDAEAFLTVKQALKRLESIDNAEPSKAMKYLERIGNDYFLGSKDCTVKKIYEKEFTTIKQALLKQQESKQYLKWEDLEFKEKRQEIPVRMGNTIYTLVLRKTANGTKITKLLSPKRNYMGEWGDMFYEEAKQFFNDLRLERVE